MANYHLTSIKTFQDILQQISRHFSEQIFNKGSDWLTAKISYLTVLKTHSTKSKQAFVMKTSKMAATRMVLSAQWVVIIFTFECVCALLYFLKRKKCVHQLVTPFSSSKKEVKGITMDHGMVPNHFCRFCLLVRCGRVR